jgi:predicted DNA-binding transcriptional regulator AlpA
MMKMKEKPQLNKPLRGELLTAVEVGERLKLSEKTLYNWKKTGELPIDYFYIHGNLRFDSADVEEYIALSKIKSSKAQLIQAILQCGDVDPKILLEEWLEPIVKKIIKTGGVGMKK